MSEEIEDSVVEESQAEDAVVDSSPEPAEQEGAEPQQQDVWQHFRQMEQFSGQDDHAIASRLYEAMQREAHATRALQQYQTAVPVVQDYLANRASYEQWKTAQAQQQAPEQAPQQAETPWWNPPELKESYKRYIVQDESGRDVISPDAPLDAKAALQDYMDYRANFAQKFLDNPEQTLGPMVEKVAMQRAEQLVEEKFGRMRDENYVAGLEKENADWLYDEQGNVSAEGLSVQKYIADAKGIGINGAQARWDYATRMVERDLLLATLKQMQGGGQTQQQAQMMPPPQAPAPQQTVEQRNMQYLRQQAMRAPSQRSSGTTTARTPDKTMTFQERLTAAAQEQGLF